MSDLRHDYDVVVVGAGPAGIAAACVAAASGRRVALLEATPWLGGQIWRETGLQPAPAEAQWWLQRLRTSGAQVFERTTVVAAWAENLLLADRAGSAFEVTWKRLIIATGARELLLPFPGWTLPNVVGPGALQLFVKSGWPIAGKRVVIAGSGPLLLAVAAKCRDAGAEVSLIAEQANLAPLVHFGLSLAWLAPGKLAQGARFKAKLLGVPYRTACWPVEAHGSEKVESVTLRAGGRSWTEPCDYLACAFGLVPNLELAELLGCRVRDGFVEVNQFQETSVPHLFCAGEPTGIGGVDAALVEGQIAGYATAGREEMAARLFKARAKTRRFAAALEQAFALRPELKHLAAPNTIVCRCEDVRRRQLQAFDSWRAAKLHTRCGMGPCQGRVCGSAVRVLFGWNPESIRPPIFATSVATLMGIGTCAAPQNRVE